MPSDEVSTFKILKSVKELVAAAITSVASLQDEVLLVVPQLMLVIASFFGINDEMRKLIERGGHSRGVVFDVSYSGIEPVRELLDIGEDIRIHGDYRGIPFGVLDRRICLSSINVDINRASLNEPISMIFTDDPTYARYLTANFEMLWQQSVPAQERIQELLEQGPPLA